MGKKLSPERVCEIMAVWAETDNYNETSKRLGVPWSTVKKIVTENREKPEYVDLCDKKRKDFVNNAIRIRDKALVRLERELDDEDSHIPANHLTTVIGTLYDKIALAEGKSTENREVTVKLPQELLEYAE